MMLSRWQSTIVDAQGNVQPGAVLTIRHESDQSLAQVYMSPSDQQPYPLGQVPADSSGFAYFYAPAGLYRIQSQDLSIDWRHVALGSAATRDVGTGPDAVPTNSMLGTAAARDVTTSATDTTSGRVPTVGWMGLGAPRLANDNSATSRFSYYYEPNHAPLNYPADWYGYGSMLVINHGYSGGPAEIIIEHANNARIGFRGRQDAEIRELYHSGNFPPIGFVYTQYPGEASPSDLFGGTWTLLFNTEGVFFRTEGQGASSFGGGIQGDAIRNITGSFSNVYANNLNNGQGAFITSGSGQQPGHSSSYGGRNTSATFDASRVVPTASENRPRNRTIRVWKKTAN